MDYLCLAPRLLLSTVDHSALSHGLCAGRGCAMQAVVPVLLHMYHISY